MMASAQNHAVRIERTMQVAFKRDRFEVGGLINSDYIRKYPFSSMMITLAYLCENNDTENLDVLSDFFGKYSYYSELSINEILEIGTIDEKTDFVNEDKSIGGESILMDMISAFNEAYKKLK